MSFLASLVTSTLTVRFLDILVAYILAVGLLVFLPSYLPDFVRFTSLFSCLCICKISCNLVDWFLACFVTLVDYFIASLFEGIFQFSACFVVFLVVCLIAICLLAFLLSLLHACFQLIGLLPCFLTWLFLDVYLLTSLIPKFLAISSSLPCRLVFRLARILAV